MSLPRQAPQILAGAVLVFAPWAIGATSRWALLTVQVLTILALVALLAIRRSDQAANPPRREPDLWHWAWGLPLTLLALYLAISAFNPSYTYQPFDNSLMPRAHITWLPHSANAAITWQTLGKLLTYAALFVVIRASFRDDAARRTLLTVLAISGFVMALTGIAVNLTGSQKLLGFIKSPSAGFGPFVNRNNYAAYANLLLPVFLALGRIAQRRAAREGTRSHPGYLFYFMAAMLMVSVFLSQSRAGMALATGLVLGWLAIEGLLTWRRHGARAASRSVLVTAGVVAVVLVGLIAYVGFEPIQKRIGELEAAPDELLRAGERAQVRRATLAMFQAQPVFGVGAGTFSVVFPYYQPESTPGYYRHAHCDWAQYLAELGLVGVGLLGLTGAGAVWMTVRAARTRSHHHERSSFHRRLIPALVLSLAGLAVHAGVDFPVHIPAIALTAMAWLGLLITDLRPLTSAL